MTMAKLTVCLLVLVYMHLMCPPVKAPRNSVVHAVLPLEDKHDTPTSTSAGVDNFCLEDTCRCVGTTADCSGNRGNLTFVPKLPPGIVFLNFSYNNVSEIGDDFFLNVTNITGLDLSHNKLSVIHSGAFRPLAKLDTLILNDNSELNYTTLVPVFMIPGLKTLDLENLRLGSLPSDVFRRYPMRHLENLDLQHNSLGDVDLSVFAPLGNLRVLNLSDNEITALRVNAPNTIKVLNVQGNSINSFPETCAAGSSLFPVLESLTLNHNKIPTIPDQVCLPKLRVLNLSHNSLTRLKTRMFETKRFPSLRELYLDVSDDVYGAKLYIQNDSFTNGGLDLISLRGANWYLDSDVAVDRVFYGCQNLSSLFMSGPGQGMFAECFFKHAVGGYSDKSNQLFRPLPSLKHLDVGICDIDDVTVVMSVDRLKSLSVLILSGNRIGEYYDDNSDGFPDGVFDSFKNLVYLDLSHNKFPYVTESMFSVETFERLHHLDFSGNPFKCSCDILVLKDWLTLYTHSPLLDSPRTSYTCTFPESSTQIPVVSYSVVLQTCLYPQTVFTIVFAVLLYGACFGGCCFCWYRWEGALARIRRFIRPVDYEIFRPPENVRRARMRRQDYQYDVFVSYASEDEGFLRDHLIPQLEGRLGLKLCLHDRDFVPGKEIMANITDSLEASRRTMLIFSTEFARSRWCQFELTLCLTHVMDNADVMLVVCLEEMPNLELTTNMEAVLRTCTYLQWSNEPHAMARFWSRLGASLRAL